MKKNPFYGISAAAMLFGCYLLNHALGLEPGRLGGLLLLVGVLQVYEGLLVALGVHLVATKRAPRDGLTVLLIGTLFLMDAAFLATECVTAAPGAGAGVAVLLMGLAAGKLALVRRFLPDALPAPVAVLLGAQAVLVLALPIAVVQLAEARLLAPVSLYVVWWVTLALPLARKRMADLTPELLVGEAGPGRTVWTWIPAASIVLHLGALGWIHQMTFHPAYLAPFLLGMALTTRRDQVEKQIALPALAVLLSVGQTEALAFPLLGASGPWVSPLRLAALAAATVWATLAWRHGYRWLVALAAGVGLVGLLGTTVSGIAGSVGVVLRFFARLVPRDTLGWGLIGVAGGFVFLAVGAWNSFRGEAGPQASGPTTTPAAGQDGVVAG